MLGSKKPMCHAECRLMFGGYIRHGVAQNDRSAFWPPRTVFPACLLKKVYSYPMMILYRVLIPQTSLDCKGFFANFTLIFTFTSLICLGRAGLSVIFPRFTLIPSKYLTIARYVQLAEPVYQLHPALPEFSSE